MNAVTSWQLPGHLGKGTKPIWLILALEEEEDGRINLKPYCLWTKGSVWYIENAIGMSAVAAAALDCYY